MEAVEYTPSTKSMEIVEMARPKARKPHDVLIRVMLSDVSDKDLHIIKGSLKRNYKEGAQEDKFILGRNCCGVVLETGPGVTTVKRGSKVVVDPNGSCGYCPQCRAARTGLCQRARNVTGCWARYVCVHESQVHQIPRDLELRQALFAEFMSRILQCWDLISPLELHERILIGGVGIMGLLWVVLLHYRGYRRVSVCDHNLARLELVEKMSLNYKCLAPVVLFDNFTQHPEEVTFDVVVDCAACPDASELYLELLASGGRLCICGADPNGEPIKTNGYALQKKQAKIVAVNSSSFKFPQALAVLDALGKMYLDYETLCVKTYPLKECREAVKHMKKGSIVKAVFSMGIQCECKGDGKDKK